MTQQKTTTPDKKSQTDNIKYHSNPFSLSFDKFGQLFENNIGWAIALIILPILGFFFQMMLSFVDALVSPEASAHAGHAHSGSHHLATVDPAAAGVAFLVVFALILFISCIIAVSIAIQVFIGGLFTYAVIENEAGRKAKFSSAIDAVVSRYQRLFFAQLLATVKIFAWTLLFIIPGIIAAFRYMLLPFVIMDEPASEKGVKKSHDRVKALVAGRKMEVFGVYTIATIIPLIGGITQLVGNAALYRQLQIFHDKKLEKPSVHWLNYFGLVLFGILMLLIFAITALAIVVAINS